jgi:hypothetical protein
MYYFLQKDQKMSFKHFRFLLGSIVYSGITFFSICLLSSCAAIDEENPATLDANTQLYQVNSANSCDFSKQTPAIEDDCDYVNQTPGYYYHGGGGYTFYRMPSGENMRIERQGYSGVQIGQSVRLTNPVITNENGIPLTSEKGFPVKAPRSSAEALTKGPVRSSSNFSHPSVGKISGGRTTSASSRGMSFSGSRGGFGG